jgi:hypothetical protein
MMIDQIGQMAQSLNSFDQAVVRVMSLGQSHAPGPALVLFGIDVHAEYLPE